MNKISTKIKDIFKEISAITWPSRGRVTNDTVIVVLSLIFGSAIIALIDKGLLTGLQKIIEQIQQ